MTQERAANILLIVGTVAMALVVGYLSQADAQAERAFYCEMVKTDAWPDYKGIAAKECRAIVEKDSF